MTKQEWLLFISQLPASPSSPRVKVWRQMRATGAMGLQNGVWLLPRSDNHATFLEDLLEYVEGQDGRGHLFVVDALNEKLQADYMERFIEERRDEYEEFLGHCRNLLDEIAGEISKKKFTYAELEETEANLERLDGWLRKIQGRDFFESEIAATAVAELARCHQALDDFANRIYAEEGVDQDE